MGEDKRQQVAHGIISNPAKGQPDGAAGRLWRQRLNVCSLLPLTLFVLLFLFIHRAEAGPLWPSKLL